MGGSAGGHTPRAMTKTSRDFRGHSCAICGATGPKIVFKSRSPEWGTQMLGGWPQLITTFNSRMCWCRSCEKDRTNSDRSFSERPYILRACADADRNYRRLDKVSTRSSDPLMPVRPYKTQTTGGLSIRPQPGPPKSVGSTPGSVPINKTIQKQTHSSFDIYKDTGAPTLALVTPFSRCPTITHAPAPARVRREAG